MVAINLNMMSRSSSFSDELILYYGSIDPNELKTWISYMANLCYRHLKDAPEKWVHYAKQFLADKASDWYKTFNPSGLDMEWDKFVKALKENFYPPDYEIMLVNAFTNIRCTSSISDYNSRFLDLMTEVPEWYQNEEIRIYHYIRGLPGPVAMHVSFPKRKTLNDMMIDAEKWEYSNNMERQTELFSTTRSYNYRSIGHRPRNSSNNNFHNQYKKKFNQSDNRSWRHNNQKFMSQSFSQQDGSKSCDISRFNEGSRSMSKKERQFLISQGLCFNCRVGRHYARNCPQNNSTKVRVKY